MSRHRTVRSMNYEDEYDGYDDVYGHSVEDDYCVSPCTAAQFTFDRSNQHSLSSFLASEEIPEEEEEEEDGGRSETAPIWDDNGGLPPALRLTDTQQAQLNSCLEELRSILDESVSEQQMVQAVISAQFDTNSAVNALLNAQLTETAKPQRKPRERRRQTDDPTSPPPLSHFPQSNKHRSLAALAQHLSSSVFDHPHSSLPKTPPINVTRKSVMPQCVSLASFVRQNLDTMTNSDHPMKESHHDIYTLRHDNKPAIGERISLSQLAQLQMGTTADKATSLAGLASTRDSPPTQSIVKAPPGFRSIPSMTNGYLGLSQFAAIQSAQQPARSHVAEAVIPAKTRKIAAYKTMTRAMPSSFARTLCTRFQQRRKLRKRRLTGKLGAMTLRAFDFCTPSPDDIVKEKQKAAFTNPALRARMDTAVTDPPPTRRPGTTRPDTAQNGDILSATPARFQFGADDTTETADSLAMAIESVAVAESNSVKRDRSDSVKRDGSNSVNRDGSDSVKRDGSAEPVRRDLQRVDGNVWLGKSASAVELTGLVNQLSVTPKMELRSSTPTPRSTTKTRAEKIDVNKAYEQRKATDGKECINLVVTGHVDAGKSTLMGHLLYQLGFVQQRVIHKYEQEAKKLGKASFAFAWVLDETDEERSRGVTMDVAQTKFETETKMVTLLDAPGHKDFIPNMITGAAQADVAMLVVNATRGEFETGFESGGQTREHAILIRSLGVSQLLVAVNKMDTVDWSQSRYADITHKLGAFLRQAGFREADVAYVPCSGLAGLNLGRPAAEEGCLTSWYSGPTLLQQIDCLRAPDRSIGKPLRLCVSDIFKGQGSGGVNVAGVVLTGAVLPNDRLLVMPQAEVATVKGVLLDEMPAQCAFAGDNVVLVLTGVDITNITVGSVLCSCSEPIRAASCFRARIVLFNIDIPITKGFPVVFHYQSLSETAHIHKLVSQLHKSTGEVIKKKPRCLSRNTTAVVDMRLSRPICMELYRDFKELGRFMLRSAGCTIAAGLITQLRNCED